MLTFGHITLRGAHFAGESRLPSVFPQKNVQTAKKRELDEYDELFWDVGQIPNIMPYKMLSRYDRALEETSYETAVLENAYLRAVFLPQLGGKLWSLWDKKAGRELLYVNDCVRPCNLALCSAWTSGGVEWNIGMIGHSPFTCRRLTMAAVELPDGSRALRFYAFERVREAVYQMDFSLPEDSPVLLCRMRIKNTRHRTIPMYWFSNIAVPFVPGSRVLVNARDAYVSDIDGIGKTNVPLNRRGTDVTYAEHSAAATDYFFRIDEGARKYVAYVGPGGQGLFQASTARQRGRKLFTWGTKQGGKTWQKWLTDQAGPYVEIQAGVNPTQYECVPMPPDCAWEWMEVYGPMEMDAACAHGAYDEALAGAEAEMERLMPRERLERMLLETRDAAKIPGRVMARSPEDGWAALELIRRKKTGEDAFETHLDFGHITEEQKPWLALLSGRGLKFPGPDQVTFQISDGWLECLKKARSPYAYYQRGLCLWYRGDVLNARRLLERACRRTGNAQAAYALGVLLYLQKDPAAARALATAAKEMGGWVEFGRDYLQALNDLGLHDAAKSAYETLDEAIRPDAHIRLELARALAHLGDTDTAERILLDECAGKMADLREGMTPLYDLWLEITRQTCKRQGVPFDESKLKVPADLDNRMA